MVDNNRLANRDLFNNPPPKPAKAAVADDGPDGWESARVARSAQRLAGITRLVAAFDVVHDHSDECSLDHIVTALESLPKDGDLLECGDGSAEAATLVQDVVTAMLPGLLALRDAELRVLNALAAEAR